MRLPRVLGAFAAAGVGTMLATALVSPCRRRRVSRSTLYPDFSPTLTDESTGIYVSAGSTCGQNTITDYTSNFGDGHIVDNGTDNTAVHSWGNEGTYPVTVTVSDSCNQTQSVNYQQVVKRDNPPNAAFTVNAAGQTVYVDPSASTDDDGVSNEAGTPVSSFQWRWGDGTRQTWTNVSSSNGLASHAYARPVTYTITLMAYDTAAIASVAVTEPATVPPPPAPGPGPDYHWVFREDAAPNVGYHGGHWSRVACDKPACSPNRVEHLSMRRGDWARFVFHGKRAQVIGTNGKHGGVARIFIDGVYQRKISLHAKQRIDGAVLYTTPVLPDNVHGLQVRVRSGCKRIPIDALKALVEVK